MAAVSTALVASALIGGAATVYGVSEQKKAAKKQEKAMDAAEDEAREIAKLDNVSDVPDAEFKLGRSSADAVGVGTGGVSTTGTASTRAGSVKRRVGGLSKSVSGSIGL